MFKKLREKSHKASIFGGSFGKMKVDVSDIEQTIQAPDLLTVKEAAELLRVHHQTVRRHIRSGDLPAYRLGSGMSELRIMRDDLEGWLYGEREGAV